MSEVIRACVPRPRHAPPPHAQEMALLNAEVWAPGTTLRIAFAWGTRAQRRAVMVAAETWMRYANVRIVQVAAGPAELRCTFESGGSWSYVGRGALTILPAEPTMNMGWPDDPGRDLHELGHALGCLHEHQWGAIPWDREACYRYYGGPPNRWSRAEVDQQVLDREPADQLVTTPKWDRSSIMEYPIPRELVTDPAFVAGWNQALSPGDIAMIRRMYPK